MKRLIAILCAVALAAFTPAFAAANDYTGLWYLLDMTVDGETFDVNSAGIHVTLELLEDGTVNQVERTQELAMKISGDTSAGFTLEDEEEQSTGAWKETAEGEITVQIDEDEIALALVDGQLVLTEDDENYGMRFGREEPVATETPGEPAPAVSAELEDFEGDWEPDQVYLDGACMNAELFGMDLYATIEGTTVTLYGFLFDESEYEMQFQDGVLTYTAEDTEEEMFDVMTMQMLEDGKLAVVMGTANPMTVTLIRSEEEEEAEEE